MQVTDSISPAVVHSPSALDTLVIGAGISGLTLAHTLYSSNPQARVWVCESQGQVGGNITTRSEDGFLWEEGPNSFSPTPELLQLTVDAGLKSELVLADRRLPRYVFWNGKLQAVPMSPPAMISSRLLSPLGKLRALVGALGFVPPKVGAHWRQQAGEETVAQFFQRHLGTEVTERLVAPFVSGVYAGNHQALSAAAAFGRIARLEQAGGGLLAGALLTRQQRQQAKATLNPDLPKTRPGELGSYKTGLQALPQAIADSLGDRVKLHWRLIALQRHPQQTYIAIFDTPEGQQQVEARSIVFTTPAHVTAELLRSLQPEISQPLEQIPYPPVACVVLAYPQTAMRHSLKGFGNLIPRHQGIRTLGTIWSSSLFPGRTPAGQVMLTNFIGGATDPAIGDLSESQIIQAVHQDLSRFLLDGSVQPRPLAVHLWQRAIPQYTLGHHQRLAQIQQSLESLPGIYLCSNYLDGVSLGDCVRRGKEKAAEVQQFLKTQGVVTPA